MIIFFPYEIIPKSSSDKRTTFLLTREDSLNNDHNMTYDRSC